METTEQFIKNRVDETIKLLQDKKGIDYSAGREQLEEAFDSQLDGNWDTHATFDSPDLPDLRIIQEDEYDQHMDEDEDRPKHRTMFGYVGGYYVFPG